MSRPLHVLVVDDSAVVREAMTAVLADGEGITVATAPTPIVARRRMALKRPDVIVLDLDMPEEDGLTFLRAQMAQDPIPVVICSSHSVQGSRAALQALHEGALEVVAKPRIGVREFVQESKIVLLDAIRAAAAARVRRRGPVLPAPRVVTPATPVPAPISGAPSRRVIAIAASTGGPQALLEVLQSLPPDTPGIVVVQHMPAGFTTAFAKHLDERCEIAVREAESGDDVRDGLALLAPGGRHLSLRRSRTGFAVDVTDGGLVSRHRPSADVLFASVAEHVGGEALGVILTGMGDDGAEGLVAMQATGAATVAQDEATCVVYGMPKEAVARGAIDVVLPISQIPDAIARWTKKRRRERIPTGDEI
ncbi:MAG TPA: chemotaxis response regulator protein-glutamate methylesterase [Gemmatimonadales bacterium]|jgi:two-component system chemotaxis response regulator CheB|nr:chemotaxis response regulator protein-glutamate methylesterase [Gemmatimonadales bacterium]